PEDGTHDPGRDAEDQAGHGHPVRRRRETFGHRPPPQCADLVEVAIVGYQLLGAVHVDSPSSTRDRSATQDRPRSTSAKANRSCAYSGARPTSIPCSMLLWITATESLITCW